MEDFKQLCVWERTLVGTENVQEFIEWLNEQFGVRGKYCEEVKTLPTPNVSGTGGRNDLFFYIHDEDVSKFSIPRLMFNIRWWEDVLGNGNGCLYPKEILEKYPTTW
jgi:hypothetical protein